MNAIDVDWIEFIRDEQMNSPFRPGEGYLHARDHCAIFKDTE
jgi:hypothetical protein